MKRLFSVIHIVLVIVTFVFCAAKGQYTVEMIPYRLVPAFDEGCHLEIEIIRPITLHGLPVIYSAELEDVIIDRIVYETTNQFAQNEVFTIDSKHYYLLRVPYTGAVWNNGI